MNFEQLAKAMKTKKGFDPMPPDQYLTYKDRRYPPPIRLWAWIISKTMRVGHRSPFCVDEQGRDLSLADAYRELKLDRSSASRALRELESEGRVRREGYRIYLSAEFRLKSLEAVIEGLKLEWRSSGDSVQSVPPYVLLHIRKLPENEQKRFWAWRTDFLDRSRFAHREVLALLRAIEEQEENTKFLEFGAEKKRQKKRRPDPSPLLPLLEPLLTGIVQSRNGRHSVQGQNGGSSSPQKASVHAKPPAPSLYTEAETEKTSRRADSSTQVETPRPPSNSPPPQNQDLAELCGILAHLQSQFPRTSFGSDEPVSLESKADRTTLGHILAALGSCPPLSFDVFLLGRIKTRGRQIPDKLGGFIEWARDCARWYADQQAKGAHA